VVRTRRQLRDALISLLHARPWDEISVQDICQRADVGRSTFYVHFPDKEDLLLAGFDELRVMLRAQVGPPSASGGPLRFARSMIEHAHENRRLFSALVGKRSGQVVLRQFRALVVELVREELASAPKTPRREAAIHFIAGAFLDLLSWSLEQPRGVEVAELERWFVAMSSAALSLARGQAQRP
jgi:AcrR family transcriptional regulator